jgi:polar amino acid transport system substrate-binding protein
MNKNFVRLVFISIVSLLATSCGAAATPTLPPTAPPPTPTPAASAEILLTTGEWEPYTSEKMEGLGAFTEIVSAVFKEMGQHPKYLFYPWKRGEAETKDGKVFAIFPYIVTDERKKDFDFSDPVMISTGKLFYLPERHKAEIVYDKLEDLQAYTIGGTLGYWYETPFKQAGLQVDYTSSDEQNFQKLYAGRVDLAATEELVGWALIRKLYPQEENRFATVKKPLNKDPLRLMISRQYPGAAELTQRFNAALKAIYAKGIAQKILEKYGIKGQ